MVLFNVIELPKFTGPPPLRPVPATMVTELYANLLLAMELSANIVFVTVPISLTVTTVFPLNLIPETLSVIVAFPNLILDPLRNKSRKR